MQKIAEIMTREVETISPEENIQRAAQIMDALHIASIPVVDNGRLTGIITDRDITVRVTSAAESPENLQVKDVMSGAPRWCYDDQSPYEVAQQLRAGPLHSLPVLERASGRMIGIVSLGDMDRKKVAPHSAPEASRPRAAQRSQSRQ